MPPKAKKQKTYEVEKVVDSKGSGKNVEYLVKWEGFPSSENTWEPAANLASCKEMIAEYTKSLTLKTLKKAPAKPAAAPAKAAAKAPAKPTPAKKKASEPVVPLSQSRPKRGAPEPAAAPPSKKPKPAPKAAPPPKPKAAAPPPKPAAKPAAAKPAKIDVEKLAAAVQKEVKKPAKRVAAKKPAPKAPAKKAPAKKPATKPPAAKKRKADEEVVEVDKILEMRSSAKHGVEYKIQWKGSGKKAETSWEPEDNVMDDDLVDEFEEELQSKVYSAVSFEAGMKVEVRNVDEGFGNSWTGATVQKKKGAKFTVEYSAFVDDKGKKMTDLIERARLRPTQAAASSSWAPQIGEIVEVNDADCWWEARVQGVKGKVVKVMFRVSDEVKDLSLGAKVRPCGWLKMAAPAK